MKTLEATSHSALDAVTTTAVPVRMTPLALRSARRSVIHLVIL